MSAARRFFMLTMLLFMALSTSAHAAGTNLSAAIRGTWSSKEGTLVFQPNGTINYQGKRYFYAVSNGGTLQLNRSHINKVIPFQLAGNKLTLTIDGKATVYTRRR